MYENHYLGHFRSCCNGIWSAGCWFNPPLVYIFNSDGSKWNFGVFRWCFSCIDWPDGDGTFNAATDYFSLSINLRLFFWFNYGTRNVKKNTAKMSLLRLQMSWFVWLKVQNSEVSSLLFYMTKIGSKSCSSNMAKNVWTLLCIFLCTFFVLQMFFL